MKKINNLTQYLNIKFKDNESIDFLCQKFFHKDLVKGFNDYAYNLEARDINLFNSINYSDLLDGEHRLMDESNNMISLTIDSNRGNLLSLKFNDDKCLDLNNFFGIELFQKILLPLNCYEFKLVSNNQFSIPSLDYISKQGYRTTHNEFGFNLYYSFVIDYITPGKTKIPKDVLLKAPAFMVKELKSGSVYVRLTEEEPDPYEFIVEFVDAYMEFYNYCMDYVKSVG